MMIMVAKLAGTVWFCMVSPLPFPLPTPVLSIEPPAGHIPFVLLWLRAAPLCLLNAAHR